MKDYYKEIMRALGNRLISVCLFGSVARREFNKNSDIDFLLVATRLPRSMLARSSVTASVHERLKDSPGIHTLSSQGWNTFISEIILTPEEIREHPPILLDITGDGIILYDRGNTLHRELERIRHRLRQLGSKRVKAKEGRYWLLKPDICCRRSR